MQNAPPTPKTNGSSKATNGNSSDDILPSHNAPSKPNWLLARLSGNVDPNQCQWISVYACLLTGYTSAVSFTVSLRGRVVADIRRVMFGTSAFESSKSPRAC